MFESKLLLGDYSRCNSPILSILIPTYRESAYLIQAIDSAVNQKSGIEYEVVVVSNDPSNPLTDVIERYKDVDNLFIYRNSENIGMVGNSNRCVELARGKYIAFLHDDDYLLDNYLEVFSRYVQGNDSIKCLITGRYIEFEGRVKKTIRIKQIIRRMYFIPNLFRKKIKKITLENCLKSGTNIYFSPSCGTVINKDSFISLGGFDSQIPYSFDLDFFLRFNARYDIYETTEACSAYRIGDNASLKSIVKYDFYDYYRTKFIDIMRENNVANKYLERHKKDLLYACYEQLGEGLDSELQERHIDVEPVGRLKRLAYRFITTMYFYNHNLDIQRLR